MKENAIKQVRYYTRTGFLAWCFCLSFITPTVSQESDCRIVWSPPVQLSSDSVPSITPQFAVSGDTIHVVWFGVDTLGTAGGDGIQYCRSTDRGITFSPQIALVSPDTAISPGFIVSDHAVVCVVFFALIDQALGISMVRSVDAGSTWTSPTLILENAIPRVVASLDSTIYVHFDNLQNTSSGLLTSSNVGRTWSTRTTDMPSLADIEAIAGRLHAVGSIEFGQHREVSYFFSADFGKTWSGSDAVSQSDATPSISPRLAVSADDTRFLVWIDTGAVVFRRSRGFDHEDELLWEPQTILSTGRIALTSDVAAAGSVIAAIWDEPPETGSIGIRASDDGGLSFCQIDTPTSSRHAGEPALGLSGRDARIVWSDQIDANSEIVYRSGFIMNDRPREFLLRQNYPNPVNDHTRIVYDLPTPSHVSLILYNLLGQRVATLVDQEQAARQHQVVFRADDLPTGVYFYRIVTPSFTDTKKLLIVR